MVVFQWIRAGKLPLADFVLIGMNKLVSALLFTATLVCAQPANPPDPATMAQREVQFLTKRLGLTAAQQGEATTIFTNQFTADVATRANMKTARTALRTAIEANNSAGIQAAATEIGTYTATLTASDATAQAALYAILTPAQQTTYNQHPGGMGMGGVRPMGRFGGRQ